MMESPLNEKNLQQIRISVYPESLEQISKVVSILNEDFSFKIDDLFALKEIQKFASSKEILIQMLEQLASEGIVKMSTNESEGTIILNEKMSIYTLTNVPLVMNKKELQSLLEFSDEEVKRVYKQSLYWIIVSECEEFNNRFEAKLKSIKFEEDKSLKYSITSATMLKKAIGKIIQYSNYMKETNDLKNGSPKVRKESDANKVPSSNNEKLSWRKKSDVSTNSGNGGHDELKANNTAKPISPFNPRASHPSNKRERFSSDPLETFNLKEKEVAINPEDVKYALTISNKYSTREMVEFYDIISRKIESSGSPFRLDIEEICNQKVKDLAVPLTKTGRAQTFSHGIQNERGSITIPKNNPLLNFK